MTTVRAKFVCDSVTSQRGYGEEKVLYSAKFNPVYANGDPNHENSKFWKASPGGSFELLTIKMMPFEVGKEYYLDITLAEAATE